MNDQYFLELCKNGDYRSFIELERTMSSRDLVFAVARSFYACIFVAVRSNHLKILQLLWDYVPPHEYNHLLQANRFELFLNALYHENEELFSFLWEKSHPDLRKRALRFGPDGMLDLILGYRGRPEDLGMLFHDRFTSLEQQEYMKNGADDEYIQQLLALKSKNHQPRGDDILHQQQENITGGDHFSFQRRSDRKEQADELYVKKQKK